MPSDQPDTAAPRCCCIGMIGNTHYVCLGRGLDVGHCRGECSPYPECVEANDMIRRDADNAITETEGATMTTTAENDNDLIGNFDAAAWASRFVERVAVNPAIATDEGTMLAWFASAIMTGYDKAKNE